eukprot:jgi/Hompol1/857/HPOL_001343-RA
MWNIDMDDISSVGSAPTSVDHAETRPAISSASALRQLSSKDGKNQQCCKCQALGKFFTSVETFETIGGNATPARHLARAACSTV